ncbi:chemotaxis-specific protein-glutamate methyltransferase CheB [Thermodesulfobacteriota bacterium]
MIRVLIVEDSAVVRDLLCHILGSDPQLEIMATANDGLEALDVMSRSKPDVITMDINMPRMDGYEATRQIMETNPVPIVIVSASMDPADEEKTWRALETGAVAALEKPRHFGTAEYGDYSERLVRTVKLMSEVKVVRRWRSLRAKTDAAPAAAQPTRIVAPNFDALIRLVAIGASTGGPPAIQTILSMLPKRFALPLLIVQHIAPGFSAGFARWLNQSCSLSVSLALDGETALPGNVYVAPDGFQMKVDTNQRLSLTKDPPEKGLRPSASYLFRSIAASRRRDAVGILLTGMGTDGAEELKLMRDHGAVTVAQDKETSIVHGMPGEAIRIGAAAYVQPPEGIAEILKRAARRNGSD